MQCHSPEAAQHLLIGTMLSVSEGRLKFEPVRHERIEARASCDLRSVGMLAAELIRWLPPNKGRLIILRQPAGSGFIEPSELLASVRLSVGEKRAFDEAPIYRFAPAAWSWDQLELGEEEIREESRLTGILLLVLCGGWDAWLMAENYPDTIEFWEGNILFYSSDSARMAFAEDLLSRFEFDRKMMTPA